MPTCSLEGCQLPSAAKQKFKHQRAGVYYLFCSSEHAKQWREKNPSLSTKKGRSA